MPLSWPSWLSRVEQGGRRQRLAVDRDGVAALEADLDRSSPCPARPRARWCAGGHIRAPRPPGPRAPSPPTRSGGGWRRSRRALRRVLSLAIGIWCFSAKSISCLAAGEIPFAPRRDHPDVGLERIIAELEADLVVALAGGAVADRVGADLRGRSRSGAWRSAAGRSRCRADTGPRRPCWRGTSGRRSRGRTPRAGPR